MQTTAQQTSDDELTPTTPASAPAPGGDNTPRTPLWRRIAKESLLIVVLISIFGFFCGYILGVQLPGLSGPSTTKTKKPIRTRKTNPRRASRSSRANRTRWRCRRGPHRMGIRKGKQDLFAVAKAPTTMRPLVLSGSTARSRSPCPHPSPLRRRPEWWRSARSSDVFPQDRTIRVPRIAAGRPRRKGEVLGIFYSVDVGSKKNDLLDALVQLELDQKILDNAEKHREAVPEVFMVTPIPAVQGDRNAINRALNNLKAWDIPQDEIDALHEEAKKISCRQERVVQDPRRPVGERRESQARQDRSDKNKENPWGRVTLRAPFDGVIVERNVHVDEMVVDNTVNLFQIADVSRLLVIANAPEDQLPVLEALDAGPTALDRPNRRGGIRRRTSRNHRRDRLPDRPQSAHGGHQGICG